MFLFFKIFDPMFITSDVFILSKTFLVLNPDLLILNFHSFLHVFPLLKTHLIYVK